MFCKSLLLQSKRTHSYSLEFLNEKGQTRGIRCGFMIKLVVFGNRKENLIWDYQRIKKN